MQLFSSIHTISSRVNSFADRPASFSHFGKAVSMVTFGLEVAPPCQMARREGGRPAGRRITFRPFEAGGAGRPPPRQDWLRQGVGPLGARRGVSSGSAERGAFMPGNRLVGWRSGWALKAAWWITKTLCASANIILTTTSSPRLPHLGLLLGSTSEAGKGWFKGNGTWLLFYIKGENTWQYTSITPTQPAHACT